MGNGYMGWNGVGVDDDVWCDVFGCKGYVFYLIGEFNGIFLFVVRCKFVVNLRNFGCLYFDFDVVYVVLVGCEYD